MPPRPFPFPLSIGTDIVHVKRIHDILLRARGRPAYRDRFLRRFLTPGEVQEFQTRFSDVSKADNAQLGLISKHIAGRWAAKEAAIKAVNWRMLSFHDVIIQRAKGGLALNAVIVDETSKPPQSSSDNGSEASDAAHPSEVPAGQSRSEWRPELRSEVEGQIAKISISHDGEYATAVCLAIE